MVLLPLRIDFTSVPVRAMPASTVSSTAKLKRALRFSAMTLIGRSFFSAIFTCSRRWSANIGTPDARPKSGSRPLQQVADLGEQDGLFARFDRLGGLRGLLVLDPVHDANDEEQNEGDDDEVQRQGQKIAPGQYGALLLGVGQITGRHGFGQAGEVVR